MAPQSKLSSIYATKCGVLVLAICCLQAVAAAAAARAETSMPPPISTACSSGTLLSCRRRPPLPAFYGRGSAAIDSFSSLHTVHRVRMQRITGRNILSPLSDEDGGGAYGDGATMTATAMPSTSTFTSIPTYLQLRGGAGGGGGSTSASSTPSTPSSAHMITGGSLSSALAMARSQARLLVVYIPNKSKSKAARSNNGIAETSLNSDEVARASNKPSRRKKGDTTSSTTNDFGSFVVWTPDSPTSSEAAAAVKRLRVKYPGKGRKSGGGGGGAAAGPILLVAYVAQHPTMVDSSTGRPRLVPKVLAQHHCNPPPDAKSMSLWLNTLRKRHAKQYAAMQHHIREARLYTERVRGYASSQMDDENREMKERQARAEAKAREEEEARRKEAMEQRRAELLDSLPDEPEAGGAGTITIALRFADGRTGRRRFDADDATMGDVFNWVDAVFEMERERIELSTMTGQKKFVFGEDGTSEMTLSDAGLGKMTGLRVTEIEAEEDTNNGDEEEEEEEEEEDDEEEDDEYDDDEEEEEL
eukprot:CAMPEP_0178508600 /NCGR_PEP_ID=MMETSP0696-20121128/20839_1 /TAXON_ID=265572 /ORGANISM="Extubocellulus spinifer, Strain CCMP396" /LENGTH=529 /DNA_ID=CAMNT_0020138165 /DNA_START=124 /DNA_END=1713 /DNA_ORIENTATION=-